MLELRKQTRIRWVEVLGKTKGDGDSYLKLGTYCVFDPAIVCSRH